MFYFFSLLNFKSFKITIKDFILILSCLALPGPDCSGVSRERILDGCGQEDADDEAGQGTQDVRGAPAIPLNIGLNKANVFLTFKNIFLHLNSFRNDITNEHACSAGDSRVYIEQSIIEATLYRTVLLFYYRLRLLSKSDLFDRVEPKEVF
jgi:hypothetical protein